jgi:P27 family predicted phage terminase small subunit
MSEAPAHLSAASRRLWAEIVGGYDLNVDEVELLKLALTSLDVAEAARVEVARDGVVIRSRLGALVAHPAVGVADRAAMTAARLFKQIGLPAPTGSALRVAPALGRHRSPDRAVGGR